MALLPVHHAHSVSINFTREYHNIKEITTHPLGLYNVRSLPICLVPHLSLNIGKKLRETGLAGGAVQTRHQPKPILAVLVTRNFKVMRFDPLPLLVCDKSSQASLCHGVGFNLALNIADRLVQLLR